MTSVASVWLMSQVCGWCGKYVAFVASGGWQYMLLCHKHLVRSQLQRLLMPLTNEHFQRYGKKCFIVLHCWDLCFFVLI